MSGSQVALAPRWSPVGVGGELRAFAHKDTQTHRTVSEQGLCFLRTHFLVDDSRGRGLRGQETWVNTLQNEFFLTLMNQMVIKWQWEEGGFLSFGAYNSCC